MNRFVYWFANFYTRWIILPLYASFEVRGRENVPLSGPLVVACNHLNDVDPGALAWGIPRPIVFMTKEELFKVPLLKQFLVAYGAFPVRRNQADLGALRKASEVLKSGMALAIFPEGRRSGGEAKLIEAWPGAGLVALRGDYPVLPCAITGSQHMSLPLMFVKPFRRWKIVLTIGEPFHLPATRRLDAEAAREGTRLIMEKVAALLPEQYRGYYGSKAAAETLTMPRTSD